MKTIYCANNDTVYQSAAEAADKLGLKRGAVSKAASGISIHTNYYLFLYIENDKDFELNRKQLRRQMIYNAFKIKLEEVK